MKNKITIISLALAFSFSAKAQVTIPDANFATFLQTNYPSCMTGNVLDTICAAGITGTLNCANLAIADLTGIQYFTNLSQLYCSNNLLASLPQLPNGLTDLGCDGNSLTSLPTLPNTLLNLTCYTNQLTSLPTLPNSLTDLWCMSNQITSLPILPNSLLNLACSTNPLVNLPSSLPDSLIYLECATNQLTSLPPLPAFLQLFNCADNQITSLPALPNSLTGFGCDMNLLTYLPILPNSLTQIICSNNQLASLPNLPNGLTELWCYNNNISCLPLLPNSLTDTFLFKISSNSIHCFPNYVSAMNPTYLAYPLCITGDLLNNPNGCTEAQGILGYTYKDVDSNCVYGSADLSLQNIQEQLYDNTSTLIAQTISAMNGVYDFPESIGTYTVNIDTTGMPFVIQCAHPGIDSTVVLTAGNPIQTNVNFSITCKPGFDVGVRSVVVNTGNVRPGQVHNLQVVGGDLSNWYNLHCATGISGQVVITVAGPVTYTGVTTGALTPSIAGNIYTYAIADFGSTNISTSFGLVFTTNTSAQNGDSINVTVSVTPTSGDNNVSNNNYSYTYFVVNSYDPNYKETTPMDVQPGFDDYFTYTIHFQNTGSAAAININLQDTLDANLDLRTFQITNYSSYCTALLTGNQLSFTFPNIQLPDSTSSFTGSQGFVQYRIKPLAGLPAGTQIHNKASIYFDYNAPIVTNTTVNQYMLTTGIKENKVSTLSVYPNPSNGKYFVKLSDGTDVSKLSIEVTNLLGEIIVNTKTQNILSQIDLSNQPAGIYFVRVVGSTKSLNQRVVKE